ncbi:Mediator of DNA damage checkpoint protein 1 [Bienertia sinuspersici]
MPKYVLEHRGPKPNCIKPILVPHALALNYISRYPPTSLSLISNVHSLKTQMARKKPSHSTSSNFSPISIGNCQVLVDGSSKGFKCEPNHNSLLISASKGIKVNISVMEDVSKIQKVGETGTEEESTSSVDCRFLLINPKDADSRTKSLLQEILCLYLKELPAMNYAANTGKQSSFLERCVSSGKFWTLVLSQKYSEDSDKIIAAMTYQIVPADTQYAEVPLAAVSSLCQNKGVGRLVYMELRKRLQDVGISTVLCWGDKESEGFWHKQGFVSIAEVDAKGRTRRLPIRADIRRALCFPGGSTLMVAHLNDNLHNTKAYSIKLCLKTDKKSSSSTDEFYSLAGTGEALSSAIGSGQGNLQLEQKESITARRKQHVVTGEETGIDARGESVSTKVVARQISTTYERNTKRRVWETSSSSLKSKRVKAVHVSGQPCSNSVSVSDKEVQDDSPSNGIPLGLEENMSTKKGRTVEALMASDDECASRGKCFNVMLMDIADGPKKDYLTKIVEDLGGAVTGDGSLCTHVLTGKVRKTLKFCTALCSGAWILSPNWLKESSRNGKFVDELPFLLKDEDYLMKSRVDLKEAVLRARRNPRSLLKGYSICLTTHVQPPINVLSAIVKSAGGDVSVGLGEIGEKSTTIFVACEEDMDEALLAVKSGVRTFGSEWLMNCVMKQELDLDAPQFAESL